MIRTIHRAIENLTALLIKPSHKQVDPPTPHQPTEDENRGPRPQITLGVIAQPGDAWISQQASQQESSNTYNRKALLVQWLLFLATLAAFGAAVYYASLAKDANKISREALESVQRAFLNFRGVDSSLVVPGENVRVPGLIGRQRGIRFSAAWENTGSTPALSMLTYFSVDELPDDQIANFQFSTRPGTRFQRNLLGPRALGNSGYVVKPEDFWTSMQSKKTFYFWGWRIYRDVFPGTPVHVTEFCSDIQGVFRAAPAGPSPSRASLAGIPPSFQFGDCKGRHNCADEDCEDYASLALFWELRKPAK